MAVMQGDLAECSVPDLLQFFQGTRKQGQLLIENSILRKPAGVYFSNGEVLHAYCPPREGPPAIYQLLKWHEGKFAFLKDMAPTERTIHQDLQNLLLEGLRQIDEFNLLRDQLPSPTTILYLERDSEKTDEIRMTQPEWKMLSLVNGRRTLGQVIEMSGRSENETGRILYGLLIAGLITVTHDDAYLSAIVPEKISAAAGSKRRAPPPTILASLLLNKIDGGKSLKQIQRELGCTERDLVEEFRLLMRTEWLRLSAGEEEYKRFLDG
ncbi:MAG: DUF4388 domain-containing protein [Thermoanaerobaculia bacterium]